MEHINKIELLGEVQASKIENGMQHLLLKTRTSTPTDDVPEVWETMQVTVTAHLGKGVERVTLGDFAHIIGRLCQVKFASADGTTRTYFTVKASQVRVITD